MFFDFNEYYNKLVLFPFVFIVIAVIIFVIALVSYFKHSFIVRRFNYKFDKRISIIIALLSLLIFLLGYSTMNKDLLYEGIADSIQINGIITNVDGVDLPPKFTYNDIPVTPKIITVNGEELYIMFIGDFEMGDNVTIEYLPKSHIVLSIDFTQD